MGKEVRWLGSEAIDAPKVEFQQSWKIFGIWLTFVDVTFETCEKIQPMCHMEPNQKVTITDQHPPFAWFTPFGDYRSRQIYKSPDGSALACIDLFQSYKKIEP